MVRPEVDAEVKEEPPMEEPREEEEEAREVVEELREVMAEEAEGEEGRHRIEFFSLRPHLACNLSIPRFVSYGFLIRFFQKYPRLRTV